MESDIYGPVDKDYKEELERLVGEETRYCGVISANESVGVLKDYFALLFPPHYKHDGIPGTAVRRASGDRAPVAVL